MTGSMERSNLHLEGTDDLHSVHALLSRHGIECQTEPRPREYPDLNPAGGIEKLLAVIETAVKVSSSRKVGFVLDANTPLADRWRAVRDRLEHASVVAPRTPPRDGFIGISQEFRTTVGVWLMPDNEHDGKLEHFLQTLIDEGDPLLPLAESSTATAKDVHMARFSEPDRINAVLHAWLAWQQQPGRPFGTAIRTRFFRHDSQAATAFVSWFKRLYGIP